MSCHIKYTEEIIPVNYFEQPYAAIFCWLLTKSNQWAYEQEVRALYLTQPPGLKPFDKSSLAAIYYGIRIPEENIQQMEAALMAHGYHPARRAQMQMEKKRFGFKPSGFVIKPLRSLYLVNCSSRSMSHCCKRFNIDFVFRCVDITK